MSGASAPKYPSADIPPGEDSVLIYAPTGNDARLTAEFLTTANRSCAICRDLADLCTKVEQGCGAILLAEEALGSPAIPNLLAVLREQPPWSDIPLALISSGGMASRERLRRLGIFGTGVNVTLLERPFRPETLLSVVEVSLRARRRQYELRKLLVEVRGSARRAEVISEIAGKLLLTSAPSDLLPEIFAKLAAEIDAKFYFNYLLTKDEPKLVLANSAGLSEADRDALAELQVGDAVCGLVAQQQESIVLSRVDSSDWPPADRIRNLGVRAYACQPLKVGDRLLGTLSFGSTTRDFFTDEQLRFLRTACDLVAASIERQRLMTEASVARETAEQANRAKDDFLAALSHELRTPLNPVLLLSTEAADNPDLPPAIRSDFDLIAKNAALEARLIDDLLDLTRITRGKLKLEHRLVDVHAVIRDALETTNAEMFSKHLTITLNLAAQNHWMRGDAVRLQQVFWNVLKNAVKFTPAHGRITVDTFNSDDDATFTVTIRDTGVGMTDAELERVFHAFSQGDHANAGGAHRFGGLGLGLTISRMLTELHAGSIAATSDGPGLGSTFTITLPLASLEDIQAEARHQPRAPLMDTTAQAANSRGHILVVEDHEPTRTSLGRLLRRRGYLVKTAGSIAEAHGLAKQDEFDLLLSDIGLPDGTGYELMEALRKNHRTLKGIALSGYGMEADLALSQRAGFFTHLTKPVNIRALDQAIALAGVVAPTPAREKAAGAGLS
jgi:signal transduction histidine kinase/ActR/RegA family two-component response regulator